MGCCGSDVVVTKETAGYVSPPNYQGTEQCKDCFFMLGWNTCKRVEGDIELTAHCSLFQALPTPS